MAFLAGCATRIPLRRTLPEWVESVFVPMFQNETSQPGLEELGARFTAEEFLRDGRVRLADKADADLVVRVIVVDYRTTAESFSHDAFPDASSIVVTAHVLLFEPSTKDKPFADLGEVIGRRGYAADVRRTDLEIEPDARAAAMRDLARAVVERVIVGYSPKMRHKYDRGAIPGLAVESRLGEVDGEKNEFQLRR